MKYLIKWDAGFGLETDVVDVDTQEQAEEEAYMSWKEDVETQASYSAEPLTKDSAEEYGHESELDE